MEVSVRNYPMKPDGSPVLLWTKEPKGNQRDHAAVFDMMVEDELDVSSVLTPSCAFTLNTSGRPGSMTGSVSTLSADSSVITTPTFRETVYR